MKLFLLIVALIGILNGAAFWYFLGKIRKLQNYSATMRKTNQKMGFATHIYFIVVSIQYPLFYFVSMFCLVKIRVFLGIENTILAETLMVFALSFGITFLVSVFSFRKTIKQ